ncbi:MAG: hypothetical protein J1D88_06145 [Treponema sp.]|nr:hypothetical protein [Treponema sp.]
MEVSGRNLVRIEIITSQALEEDFAQEFAEQGIGAKYTKLDNVKGAGCSNPHLGNAIWPQLNVMYIIYCPEDEAHKIIQLVQKLRLQYVTEGIACFVGSGMEV